MHVARTVFGCFLMLSGLVNAQTDFCIQSIQRNPDETITLTWPALVGRTYHVMSADALDGLWQDIPDGQLTAGTNEVMLCYTDLSATNVSQRFYKVRKDVPHVVMTLVLDRSGSMDPIRGLVGTMGGLYLPDAVISFINHFDDNADKAAVVTFGTTATVNIPMEQPFKNDVITLANALRANWTGTPSIGWGGGTFAQGGLTNALVQNNSVTNTVGENTIKAAIFFTDGLANMIQETFNCPPQSLLNFGGADSSTDVYFFHSDAPLTRADQDLELCGLHNGGTPSCCTGAGNTFRSAISGTQKSFVRANVTADALYRTIQVADEMRSNGMYVYSIGLGSADMYFLAQIANGTNSPTFNPSQPVGLAVIANDPANLQAVFEQIAMQILAH